MRLLLAAVLVATAMAASPEAHPFRQGKRTLVLHRDSKFETGYSRFLAQLRGRGHALTVKSVEDDVSIVSFGEELYDNIALFAPTADSWGGLDAAALTTFVDNGGNLLVAGSHTASAELRKLAQAMGVDYDAPKSKVIDHFSYHKDSDSGHHTRVLTNSYMPSRHVVGKSLAEAASKAASSAPQVLYDGTAMSVAPDNILAVRILTAGPTAYSAVLGETVEQYPQAAGAEAVLVAGIQARNNARAVFTGSTWMFSDSAAENTAGPEKKPVANTAFAAAASAWAFQEAGVLKASNLRHSRQDGRAAEVQGTHPETRDLPPSMFRQPEIAEVSHAYRIKDNVTFAVDVHEWDTAKGAWVPYVANDMQLEFVMLDPYVRTNLAASPAGTYFAGFQVPDTYGVFHFRVMYRRAGLTTLHLRDQVTVRPFRHDEYERFIFSAYPYYTSAFTAMAGVFVFSIFYLYFSGPSTTSTAAAAAAAPAPAAAAEGKKDKAPAAAAAGEETSAAATGVATRAAGTAAVKRSTSTA